MSSEIALSTSPAFGSQEAIVPASSGERRRSLHKPFPRIRRIAVWDRPGFPPDDAFHPVQCKHLSTGGISFVYPNPPCFARCVIELIKGQQFIRAAIVQITPMAHEQLCLVDCRFEGRILNRG